MPERDSIPVGPCTENIFHHYFWKGSHGNFMLSTNLLLLSASVLSSSALCNSYTGLISLCDMSDTGMPVSANKALEV